MKWSRRERRAMDVLSRTPTNERLPHTKARKMYMRMFDRNRRRFNAMSELVNARRWAEWKRLTPPTATPTRTDSPNR